MSLQQQDLHSATPDLRNLSLERLAELEDSALEQSIALGRHRPFGNRGAAELLQRDDLATRFADPRGQTPLITDVAAWSARLRRRDGTGPGGRYSTSTWRRPGEQAITRFPSDTSSSRCTAGATCRALIATPGEWRFKAGAVSRSAWSARWWRSVALACTPADIRAVMDSATDRSTVRTCSTPSRACVIASAHSSGLGFQ
jgi:hypothetical protein